MATAKLDTTELKEEFLNCSLCLEDFQDPRTLECLHTFCFQCLHTYAQSQGTKKNGDNLKCPLCRSVTKVPENGFSEIKKNHFINSLLDKVNEKQKSSPCGLCNEGKPSIVLCLDCNLGLCEYCHQAHFKIRFFTDHRLVSNEDVKSGKYEEERKKIYPLCEKHMMQNDLYCNREGCKNVICIKCKVLKHEGHPTQTVAECSFEKRSMLEEMQASLSQKQSRLEEQLKNGEATKEKNTKGLEVGKKEWKCHIKKIVSVIEKEGVAMTRKFDMRGQHVQEAISSDIATIQTELKEYQHVQSFIDKLLHHSSEYHLVNMAPATMDRGKILTERNMLKINWDKYQMPTFQAGDLDKPMETLKLIIGSTAKEDTPKKEHVLCSDGKEACILDTKPTASRMSASYLTHYIDQRLLNPQDKANIGQDTSGAEEQICAICMEEMKSPKTLAKCGHKFCIACIDKSFQIAGPKCPMCGEMYGAMRGNQPLNATMNVSKDYKVNLPGYEKKTPTYIIDYYIPTGFQTSEHPYPGRSYHGTAHKAYLPANREGTEVLKLLKKAWAARLVFTIGRSTTTGRDDSVTWNDIQHKTNIYGGPSKFGYPDATYLKRVRDELAAKGIY